MTDTPMTWLMWFVCVMAALAAVAVIFARNVWRGALIGLVLTLCIAGLVWSLLDEGRHVALMAIFGGGAGLLAGLVARLRARINGHRIRYFW